MIANSTIGTRKQTVVRAGGFATAIGLALLVPNLGLPQIITGPLVNALLLTAALELGPSPAVVLGMVTPLAAALRSVLPLPLLVMIPFIALGDAIYVLVFHRLVALGARSRLLGMSLAALAKYALLQLAVLLLIARPLSVAVGQGTQAATLSASFTAMMGWPQLLTALAGGAIALGANRLAHR